MKSVEASRAARHKVHVSLGAVL